MSYEEEDKHSRCQQEVEEEDTCHMRRRTNTLVVRTGPFSLPPSRALSLSLSLSLARSLSPSLALSLARPHPHMTAYRHLFHAIIQRHTCILLLI